MRFAWTYVLLLLTALLPLVAHADEPRQPPTQGDIHAVRQRLEHARRALDKPDKRLDETKRRQLLLRLQAVESSLVRYEKLHTRGGAQEAKTLPLYAAGAALVADDITGVGVADDVLLPFIGLGILWVSLTSHPPAVPAELERAWAEIMTALEELGHTGNFAGAPWLGENQGTQHLSRLLRGLPRRGFLARPRA
jgi:hypothetical protein